MTQQLQGIVVSNAMKNTVVVKVSRLTKHPQYGKYIKSSRRYQAHTVETIPEGSMVTIESIRPMSRNKRWKVVAVKQGTVIKEEVTV